MVKNPLPRYANTVFAAPVGTDGKDVPRSSELEKSEWARPALDVFPVKYWYFRCTKTTYLKVFPFLTGIWPEMYIQRE